MGDPAGAGQVARRFHRMKFSLYPHISRHPGVLLSEARAADAAGWHGLWFADHYMANTEPARGDVFEAWTLLSAVAAVTSNVRTGTLVSPTTFHHPAVLAKRAATVDHISGGRMVLGLGAGWQENEHRAYGVALPEPKERVDRFSEAIRVIRSLLSEDLTTFEGHHFQVRDAVADPNPVQPRLPLLVGSRGPRMLRITAQYADEWNAAGTPDTVAPWRAALVAECEKAGRPMLRTSVNAMIDLAGDQVTGPPALRGSVEELRDQVGRYADLGFDELIIADWNLGSTANERADRLAHIKTEILDRV